MLGTMKPIDGVAIAHDGQQTIAMLRRQPDESVRQLLQRLDAAIAQAHASGQRIDEINQASSEQRYLANPGGSVKTASK